MLFEFLFARRSSRRLRQTDRPAPAPALASSLNARLDGILSLGLILSLIWGLASLGMAASAQAQSADVSDSVPDWNSDRPLEAPIAEVIAPELIDSADAAGTLPVESAKAGDAVDDVRSISLDAALALAVKQNLGVEVARYEPLIAEQDMKGAWGAYDPTFSGNVAYDLTESPNTLPPVINPEARNQTRGITGGAAINGVVPMLGASLGVEWNTGRTQTNNRFESFFPRYESSLYLTAKIPLMRGFIWNEAWTQINVSKIGFGSAVDGFRQSIMDITESTINAYWDLVATSQQFEVAQKSLETANALLRQTQTQYEVGVVSKVEVVEAEAGVADREFNLITAQNNFENAEDVLIDAVLGRELQAVTSFRLEPQVDPEDYTIQEVNVERAVAVALQNLPELSAADRLIEQKEVELRFAKNARLPRFDVDGRYGFLNISGNNRVTGSSNDYEDSYDNFYDNEDGFENYTVTGTFSVPLPNRAARRNVQKSEFDLRRAKTRRARTEQDVILGVRSAARGLAASARGIEAAERRRLAAEEQLRAERIRLENGESTPFEVLQRESDLVEAESQKIGALQAYRAAEARLERAQGTILESHRIQIADVQRDPMR